MNFLQSYFLTPRFFLALGVLATLFVLGYFFSALTTLATIGTPILFLLTLLDTLLLYAPRFTAPRAERLTPERFSNGDENFITVRLQNPYTFTSRLEVIDELPPQFQVRDFLYVLTLPAQSHRAFQYSVRPTERGEYHFGDLNLFFESPLGLVQRRFKIPASTMVPTYPSFLQMRRYELLSLSARATELGIKRLRRLGHTLEFERIKPYAIGDDIRSINWKATARRGDLMVNQYQDERSQPIYSLIDMGRMMKMPFEGLTLLDYAINASLAISNIALKKQDRAGLITFSNRIHSIIPAERQSAHLAKILETLYNQQTTFQESDYETLFITVQRRISQRALLLLFTNFETLSSMRRQLRYLQRLAVRHLLIVIFFENTELRSLLERPTKTLEDAYIKTIAEKFAFEKREIVLELQRNGIQSVLTAPKDLTLKTINKYLELKARGMI
ncbi:MAG: DUF58 domain-containing protein [Chloroherpetonaceae bacterium]|nr:DUF58 domain-containing protein [Chloroherpetonaceae bacterium]MCS7212517.1 DUF58 domain-containing protein [Chloroherpetonaceae bacterium]MDW8019041.1 DUF58 domain-containing protein [Chloroherpetonaceae bacterium]MDW8466101.1 DUF58 domain-containing protein [Chloroherpetonaceae bacterium]